MVQNVFNWIPQILHTTKFMSEQQRTRVMNINALLAFLENGISCGNIVCIYVVVCDITNEKIWKVCDM